MFAAKGSVQFEFHTSSAFKLLISGKFQYFNEFKVTKLISYEITVLFSKVVSWNDTIKLTGIGITAGAAYSF
ncbi:MAG: hypothetical protein WBK20_01720 [Spirochaetota bacterium]